MGEHESNGFPAYCIFECDHDCIENTLNYEFNASLTFSLLTIAVSTYHIYMHLNNFNNPFFQSKIIGASPPIQSSLLWHPSTASLPWAHLFYQ